MIVDKFWHFYVDKWLTYCSILLGAWLIEGRGQSGSELIVHYNCVAIHSSHIMLLNYFSKIAGLFPSVFLETEGRFLPMAKNHKKVYTLCQSAFQTTFLTITQEPIVAE